MKILEGIVVAFQFLTRFYLPINLKWDEKNIKYSLLFFPIVGLAIGAILYLGNYLASFVNLNPELIVLLIWILITGGLHIDGFSDTVDGMSARADREKTLKIMDDSHIGAFGVIAIVLLILSKYETIKELILINPFAIYFSPIFARAIAGIFLSFFKTAKDSGLAYFFHSSANNTIAIVQFLLTLAFIFYFNSWMAARFIYTLLIVFVLVLPIYKKLGGLTGDVYGTIVELSELVFMMLCVF